MKTILITALTAGALSFGLLAPEAQAANVGVGINHNGVHIDVNNGMHHGKKWNKWNKWKNVKKCGNVKVWHKGHSHWVYKCWSVKKKW